MQDAQRLAAEAPCKLHRQLELGVGNRFVNTVQLTAAEQKDFKR